MATMEQTTINRLHNNSNISRNPRSLRAARQAFCKGHSRIPLMPCQVDVVLQPKGLNQVGIPDQAVVRSADILELLRHLDEHSPTHDQANSVAVYRGKLPHIHSQEAAVEASPASSGSCPVGLSRSTSSAAVSAAYRPTTTKASTSWLRED